MSETGINQPSSFNVTGRELSAYLEKHAPSLRCPACGSEDAPILAADGYDDPAHLVAVRMLTPRAEHGHGHAMCIGFCPGCGYVWQFWANPIMNWVLEQRSKASEDNE